MRKQVVSCRVSLRLLTKVVRTVDDYKNKYDEVMKYLVATFKIVCPDELLQTCRDLTADAAAQAGFESFEDTDDGIRGYVQKDLLDKTLLDEQIKDFPIDRVTITYSIEDAEDKDWNETWEEQGFEPIIVDNRIVIYDAKHTTINDLSSLLAPLSLPVPIGIDAKLAFGTGTHQTTRMIVSTLLSMNIEGKRVLDCGTGTGILGITASKLGASAVAGYDIDEWSVENAKHNAEINNVGNMTVYHGDAHVINHISGTFDIVIANINRNILLNDMNAFVSAMSGHSTLVLSGFYEEDIPILLEKASSIGLKETERKKDGDWCCLILHQIQ